MTNCSCIKGVFDFLVLGYDLENLIYQDLSEWMIGDHYLVPDTYILTITSPKGSVAQVEVGTKCSTRIEQKDTKFCFNDGIYTFSVESCGKTYSKTVGIFPTLECCLDVAIIKRPEMAEELMKIDYDLRTLKSSILLGDNSTAKLAYHTINRRVKNLECDCDTHCKK